MPSRLAAYDPAWPRAFTDAADAIQAALGDALLALHHIGSTSIPAMPAKPIIDMLGQAVSLAGIDQAASRLVPLGYEAMGEFGIEGRRYFRRTHDGRRTHHLHVFERGSPQIERHLAFRDYLRRHPAKAAAYAALKASLDGIPDADYPEAKSSFVATITAEALDWYHRHRL